MRVLLRSIYRGVVPGGAKGAIYHPQIFANPLTIFQPGLLGEGEGGQIMLT